MKEITLEQPKEVLVVNAYDKSFNIPLAGSIPITELMPIKKAKTSDEKFEFFVEFLQKYIPEEVFIKLTGADLTQIMTAWGETSQLETGVTPGES
jgi:hypothetical protein